MSRQILTVYKGRDNSETLRFLVGGSVQNLSDITRIKLIIDSTQTIDSDDSPSVFDWTTDPTKLELILGSLSLTVGSYPMVEIVLYDSVNTSGVSWGTVDMIVKKNFES